MKRTQLEPLLSNEYAFFNTEYPFRISHLNSSGTDLQINNLNGIVKTINEYHFNATNKFGELIKSKEIRCHNIFDFNEDGCIIKSSKTDTYKRNHTKTETGKTRAKTHINTFTEKYEYVNGLCIKQTEYDNYGDLSSWTEYTYNEHGYRVKEVVNYECGSVENYICNYNNNGNITEFKGVSRYAKSQSYLYEENKVTIKSFDYKSKLEEQIEYEINNKNEVIKITKYLPKRVFLFNKIFKIKEYELEYNQRGDIIKENLKFYDNEKPNYFEELNCNFVYTYDMNDNWIKMDCTMGSQFMVIEREIEYYE